MKNLFCLLVGLMLTFSVALGQDFPVVLEYKNVIKITPLKPFLSPNSAMELSYDRIHNGSYTTTYSLSYLLTKWEIISLTNRFFQGQKGFRTSIQERYNFGKPNERKFRKYIALELDYFNGSYRTEGEFSSKDSLPAPFGFYKDTFDVQKQFIGLSGKLGVQRIFNRITVDVYAGIGLRIKHCRHFDRLHPEDKIALTRKHYDYNNQPAGWSAGISMPLNIRIGYSF